MEAKILELKEHISAKEQEILNNNLSDEALKTTYEEIRALRDQYSVYLLNNKEYASLLNLKLSSIEFTKNAIYKYLESPSCISIIGDFVMTCNHISLYINMYSNDRDDIYYDVIETEEKVLSKVINNDIIKGYIIIDLNKELNRVKNEIEKKETTINEQ